MTQETQKYKVQGDEFEAITWPDIQEYMDKEGFRENCFLINDADGLDEYGSSAYMCRKSWLEQLYPMVDLIVMDYSSLEVHKFRVPRDTNIGKFYEDHGFNDDECYYMFGDNINIINH